MFLISGLPFSRQKKIRLFRTNEIEPMHKSVNTDSNCNFYFKIIFKKRNTNSLRSSFYTERVVNVWNHLPSDVVNFNTLSAFERTV